MIKAVIFDFDGVIVESVNIKTKAFAKLFEKEGPRVVNDVVKYHLENTGVSRFDKFVYVYKNILRRKLTKIIFKNLCKKYAQLVIEEVVKAPYVRGTRKFLGRYAQRYGLFIISATPQDEIEKIAQERGIARYFQQIYGAPKKKNNLVRRIIRNNHLKSKEVICVGDALSDYEAAKANSIEFIARINNNEYLFRDKRIHFKIKNLINLGKVIKKIEKNAL